MKYWILLILCILMVAFTTTVVPYVTIGGISPDIVGSFVVLVSMLSGRETGLFVAGITGVMEDMISGQFLGLFTFVRLIVAYLAGATYRKVFQEWLVVPMALVFSAGIIGELLQLFFLVSYGVTFRLHQGIIVRIILQATYSSVLSPLILYVVRNIDIYTSKYVLKRRILLKP